MLMCDTLLQKHRRGDAKIGSISNINVTRINIRYGTFTFVGFPVKGRLKRYHAPDLNNITKVLDRSGRP